VGGQLIYFKNEGTVSIPVFVGQSGDGSPFNGLDAGIFSSPAFVDLDGDGDQDVFIGNNDGKIEFFDNAGTSVSAMFTDRTQTSTTFDGITVLAGFPTFVDLDDDSDKDLFIGNSAGQVEYFENTGSSVKPVYTPRTGADNPLHAEDVGAGAAPVFAVSDLVLALVSAHI